MALIVREAINARQNQYYCSQLYCPLKPSRFSQLTLKYSNSSSCHRISKFDSKKLKQIRRLTLKFNIQTEPFYGIKLRKRWQFRL